MIKVTARLTMSTLVSFERALLAEYMYACQNLKFLSLRGGQGKREMTGGGGEGEREEGRRRGRRMGKRKRLGKLGKGREGGKKGKFCAGFVRAAPRREDGDKRVGRGGGGVRGAGWGRPSPCPPPNLWHFNNYGDPNFEVFIPQTDR